MSENPQNHTLELVRNIRADLAGVRGQIERLDQRMERMDLRLSMIDQLLGNIYALTGRDRETLLALERRVEQLERSAAQADG